MRSSNARHMLVQGSVPTIFEGMPSYVENKMKSEHKKRALPHRSNEWEIQKKVKTSEKKKHKKEQEDRSNRISVEHNYYFNAEIEKPKKIKYLELLEANKRKRCSDQKKMLRFNTQNKSLKPVSYTHLTLPTNREV